MEDIIHYFACKAIPKHLYNSGLKHYEKSGPFANVDEMIWFRRNVAEDKPLWYIKSFKLYKSAPHHFQKCYLVLTEDRLPPEYRLSS